MKQEQAALMSPWTQPSPPWASVSSPFCSSKSGEGLQPPLQLPARQGAVIGDPSSHPSSGVSMPIPAGRLRHPSDLQRVH